MLLVSLTESLLLHIDSTASAAIRSTMYCWNWGHNYECGARHQFQQSVSDDNNNCHLVIFSLSLPCQHENGCPSHRQSDFHNIHDADKYPRHFIIAVFAHSSHDKWLPTRKRNIVREVNEMETQTCVIKITFFRRTDRIKIQFILLLSRTRTPKRAQRTMSLGFTFLFTGLADRKTTWKWNFFAWNAFA